MDKLSYDSPEIKLLHEKSRDLYTIEDWMLLAEFHEHHHAEWIEEAMHLLKQFQEVQIAYRKLLSHFSKRIGLLPSRKKVPGLLNATRGRPRKTKEHEQQRDLIMKYKSLGMTDEKALQEMLNNDHKMDIRTFRRIKNGK